mgnify:CR=1 FL=1
MERAADALELVRHVVVEDDLALERALHEHRDGVARLPAAKRGSDPAAASHEEFWRDLLGLKGCCPLDAARY